MRREALVPRSDLEAHLEELGFPYHTIDGEPYWDETHCYRLDAAQVDALDDATAELHALCLNAVQHVVGSGRLAEFAIPAEWHATIARSWQAQLDGRAEGYSLFGRMDLSYDGAGPPKLLEYNADTPTACLETAVVQWHWLQQVRPGADQFNSLHEKLIEGWSRLRALDPRPLLHFTSAAGSDEDRGNLEYLRDTAIQAGWATASLPIDRIGWDGRRFVDLQDRPIERLFKLYPWEWLLAEEHAAPLRDRIDAGAIALVEPAWKMLLANKALLVVLWELYPGHPNLLPAFFDADAEAARSLGERYVRKPLLAREGANVEWVDGARRVAIPGDYGSEGCVRQALAPLPVFEGDHVLVGSWIADGRPAGIGLRADRLPVTTDASRFVPHYFE